MNDDEQSRINNIIGKDIVNLTNAVNNLSKEVYELKKEKAEQKTVTPPAKKEEKKEEKKKE